MAHAQKLIVSIVFLFCVVAHGEWRAALNRSGFFGKIGAAGIYSPTPHHELEAGLGSYTIGKTVYGQINLAYRYSHWRVPWGEDLWTPIQSGLFFIYSMDGYHYFSESPSQYPSSSYYDETRYRWGLELGSLFSFTSSRIEIGYRFRVLDNGLVAIYNNAHRDLQYYLSSGLELRYQF